MTEPTRKKLTLKRGDDTESRAERLSERLHKVLAQAGLGSRRALEERIEAGLVKVNGEPATLGQSVSGGDKIELDGKAFVATALSEPTRVLIYNKPEGEVTTREDPEGRPTIFEALPRIKGARWIAVGRLDINTTGLLLLTTDGELANTLMHPSRRVEREYVCRIHGEVSDEAIDRLRKGIELDDGPAKFDRIEAIGSSDSHHWFSVVLSEGRNREVRRMWESQGFQVSRLKRVRYGEVALPRALLRGRSEELPEEAVARLKKSLGLDEQPSGLTLQPIIGQRRSRPTEVRVNREDRQRSYVNGDLADEARELRSFDQRPRDDRAPAGRGRPGGGKAGPRAPGARPGGPRSGGPRPGGPRTGGPRTGARQPFSGPMGTDAAPARSGNRQPGGNRGARGIVPTSDNPTAFRSWYVPEGVETGPAGHRNPGATGRPRPAGGRADGAKPGGHGRPGGARPGGKAGEGRPAGARPGGARPAGGRPGGKPGGNKPGGGRPSGNRSGGPRPGNRSDGNR